MPGVIQVDNMTKAERDRLLEAISGNGQHAVAEQPAVVKQDTKQEDEGEWYTPWYVRPLQVFVYFFAYGMLGAGWLLTHIGQAMTWMGHEAKAAARSIN